MGDYGVKVNLLSPSLTPGLCLQNSGSPGQSRSFDLLKLLIDAIRQMLLIN